jgi:penicillin-binding protein 2
MKVLATIVVFMFTALSTRLWFLQILASDQFVALADQNQVRLVPIPSLRGEILDRNGNVLIGNRSSTVVLVDRLAMGDQAEAVLYRLSQLLGIPVSDFTDRLYSLKYLPYQPIPVAEDVPKQDIFYIEEHQDLFRGVSYEVDPVRQYPAGDLAAQVLGYLGEISSAQLGQSEFSAYRPGEVVGKAGVEASYERFLHGTNGTREIQVNAQGQVLDYNFGGQPPIPGDDVVLSIDQDVQRLVEQSLAQGISVARESGYKATGGAVIVLNPNNGQVVALASNPTYDPSIFLGGLSYKEALGLDLCYPNKPCPAPSHNDPLLDRAIQGLYPAGSTFKPFIATAALKEGYARTDGKYPCPPSYFAPIDPTRHLFHNWSSLNYGDISLAEALVISCDTVFYQFGYDFWQRYQKSGGHDETMQQDLRLMGFGRPTGIDLPGEQAGQIPDYQTLLNLFVKNPALFNNDFAGWLPGDAINLSIGQGFVSVTPMQLAMAYAAIANGGTLYAPHVASRIQTPDGQVVQEIQPEVLGKLPITQRQVDFLRNALTGVTVSGTAHIAFQGFPLSQIPVAGKTGTADIIPQQPYSWFAAMAPAGDPKYVVVALVEQGGHGSTTAAPIVRRVLEGLFGLGPSGIVVGNTVD